MTDGEISKDDVRKANRIKKLEEEKQQLERELQQSRKDYNALLNGVYKRDGSFEDTKRLFKVGITYWDTGCGHGLGEVITDNLLIAKLVEVGLRNLFGSRVKVETTTKKNIHDDDNTWIDA